MTPSNAFPIAATDGFRPVNSSKASAADERGFAPGHDAGALGLAATSSGVHSGV